MEDAKKINETLVRFWDEAIALKDEEKGKEDELAKSDYRELAPSPKLYEAAKGLGKRERVLDYGCGSGWASIIAAKEGCPNVEAVDLGQRIAEAAEFYAKAFGVGEAVHAKTVPADYLASVESDTYDGLICSNVLDVVPMQTAKEIIAQFSRIVKDDAEVIVSLNYYFSPEMAAKRGIALEEGYLFQDGVLRLHSLSDAEWEEAFAPYFLIRKLDYFAWPGEARETRRLFFLKPKKDQF